MTLSESISALPESSFAPGEEIISEGGHPDRIYFLKSGRVEIVRHGIRVAVIKTPGSVLGELSALLETPATATVRALEPTVVASAPEPLDFLQTNPSVNLHVSRLLAHRLDAASQYLVDVKEQLKDCSDHVGMVDGVLDSIVHRDLKKKAATGL